MSRDGGDRTSGTATSANAAATTLRREHVAVHAPVDIVIEDQWCKSCGICIDLCPKKVLAAVPPFLKAAVADLAACTGCGLCQMLCPDWCISLEPS